MLGDNVFIQALQELNNHQIQHGECSITFTTMTDEFSFIRFQPANGTTLLLQKSRLE